jgi:hypothetical protein
VALHELVQRGGMPAEDFDGEAGHAEASPS